MPKRRTSIFLDELLWWKAKELAARQRRNAQDVIADALERYLRAAEKKVKYGNPKKS